MGKRREVGRDREEAGRDGRKARRDGERQGGKEDGTERREGGALQDLYGYELMCIIMMVAVQSKLYTCLACIVVT